MMFGMNGRHGQLRTGGGSASKRQGQRWPLCQEEGAERRRGVTVDQTAEVDSEHVPDALRTRATCSSARSPIGPTGVYRVFAQTLLNARSRPLRS